MNMRIVLCLLLLAIPAVSGGATGPWISGNFGGSLYAMDDVNDDISNINALLGGSGLRMEEITKSPTLGMAIEGCMGGEHWTTPQFALTASAGFRHAKSAKVTVDNTPIYTTSGDEYTIDYSGLFVRLGFKVALSR